jgi:hypothetical protein
MVRSSLLATAAVLLLALVACSKPKPGAACKEEGKATCTGKKEALICTGGKWEASGCRGLNGCMDMGLGDGTCTNDGHIEGEPCPKDEGNPACSSDKKAMMKCVGKHWKKIEDCLGQNGCVSNAEGARCDQGMQAEGTSCTPKNEGNFSCSPDKKQMLKCTAGKMVLASKCGGRHGCRQAFGKIECDSSTAEVGYVCDHDGNTACSPDNKALLECKGGKMEKKKACKRCTVFASSIDCT